MNTLRQNIVNTIAYFDIFHYPVTNEEVRLFHPQQVCQEIIDEALSSLVADEAVYQLNEFYALHNNFQLAERRRKGNRLAVEEMKHAVKAARILSWFPYIKGLAVSGSLSKNYADEKTDIDFFIITTANRLWIARSFLHLFYKFTWLTRRQGWFCMNYYIDEQGLEIPEKNIFTAMEIVTLIPMQGAATLNLFSNANQWIRDYFPAHHTHAKRIPEIKTNIARSLVEKILNTALGDVIDKWLMQLTNKRWQKKVRQEKVNEKGIHISMQVDRHSSKPDPKNFQDKIVAQYNNKIQQLKMLQATVYSND